MSAVSKAAGNSAITLLGHIPRALLAMKQRLVDVRPELTEDECDGIDAHVRGPSVNRVLRCAFARRIIEVRDTCGGSGSHDLAEIECLVARIVAGDDRTTERMASALEESSAGRAEGVEARVLVSGGRDDELDPVVFVSLVGHGMPEVSVEASG